MGLWESIKRVFSRGQPHEPTPQEVELRPQKTVTPIIRINIGFDFGTNSSKFVYRVAGGAAAKVLCFEHDAEDLPRYCYATAMGCDDEGVFCGPKAHQRAAEGSTVLRSIKTCLTCSARGKEQCLRGRDVCVYDQTIASFSFDPAVFTPAVAATLLITQALGNAKWKILQETDQPEVIWTVNMCVPTSRLRDDDVIKEYEHVLHIGNLLSDDMLHEGGPVVQEPAEIKKSLDACLLPPPEERRTWVVSESLAAAKAYVHSLAFEDCKHVLIDIGAGTTDIAFFFYNRHDQTMHWWSSVTVPIAGDAVDDFLVKALLHQVPALDQEESFALREATRLAKEQWTEDAALNIVRNEDTILLPWQESRRAVNRVYAQLRDKYEDTWGKAYHIDPQMHVWEDIRVIVGGGGSSLPYITQTFSRRLHDDLPYWSLQTVETPRDLAFHCGSDTEFHRVAVAYGLSTRWPELPDERFPIPVPEGPFRPAQAHTFEWPQDPG